MTDEKTNAEPSAPSRGSVANLDAVPAAITVSDEDRTDKAATSHRRDRSGDTPDRPQPIEIAERLRDWADHYDRAHATTNKRTGMSIVMHAAADEIELLQSKLRLQDAVIRSGDTMLLMCSEKAAIQFMLRHAAHAADEPAFPDSADYRLHSEALYGLMERMAR